MSLVAHGRIYMATEHAFDWLLRQYDSSLGWCMRHRKTVVAFSLCVLAGTYLLFRVIPTGFMPDEDTAAAVPTVPPWGQSRQWA